MIVCSCNVFSDHQLRSTVAKATRRPRMSQIYRYLRGTPQCGRCAHTIKRIMEKITANADLHTIPQQQKLETGTLYSEAVADRGADLAIQRTARHRSSGHAPKIR